MKLSGSLCAILLVCLIGNAAPNPLHSLRGLSPQERNFLDDIGQWFYNLGILLGIVSPPIVTTTPPPNGIQNLFGLFGRSYFPEGGKELQERLMEGLINELKESKPKMRMIERIITEFVDNAIAERRGQ